MQNFHYGTIFHPFICVYYPGFHILPKYRLKLYLALTTHDIVCLKSLTIFFPPCMKVHIGAHPIIKSNSNSDGDNLKKPVSFSFISGMNRNSTTYVVSQKLFDSIALNCVKMGAHRSMSYANPSPNWGETFPLSDAFLSVLHSTEN